MKLKYILPTFLVISLFSINSVLISAQTSCPYKSLGDANCDSVINGVDYSLWLNTQCRPQPPQRCAETKADFNSDGNVDDSDYNIWFANRNGNPANPTASPTPTSGIPPTIPPISQGKGIWTSAQELANKTTSGPAWEVMFADAQKNTSNPCIHDQDDRTPNYVLAKAIVYARLSTDQSRLAEATRYKNEVVATLGKLTAMGYDGCPGNPSHAGGQKRTLAWARNLAAYIMAADLVIYQDPSFMAYINDVTNTWKDEHSFAGNNLTMREMFEYMPNNWAKWAFASLTALYRFQGDQVKLKELRTYFLGKINGPVPSGVGYYATTWHLNASNPVEINPKGAKKICPEYPGSGNMVEVVIDGLQPSEMRRAGECAKYPNQTGYAWEGMQGMVVGARILERAGMPIWEAGDKALCRAATAIMDRFAQQDSAWLPEESGNRGTGWMLVFLDKACSTNWVSLFDNQPEYKWGASRKSGGYGYILP